MDVFVYGWYPDYFDPDDYAFLYWASWLNLHYDVWSPTAYAEQIALYDQARYTTNETLRVQLYNQIEDIAADQCSIVPLFVTRLWAVTKPKISGLTLDITQDMRYWLLYIAEAEPKTWTVDDDGPADFHTIQEAINALETLDGHTIFVEAGTYYENVIVNKTVSLIGEDRDITVIDGNGMGNVVYVTANNAIVSNFTIRNSGRGGYPYGNSGIYLSASNTKVQNNNIIDNYHSLFVNYSIYNAVAGNNIANNQYGIELYYSFNNTVTENNLANTWGYGIKLWKSSGNTLINDVIDNHPNSAGISLDYSSYNLLIGNKITHSQYDGILLQSESNNNTISDNMISNNRDGIYLGSSVGNAILWNNVTNNKCGIKLLFSGNNTLRNNNLTSNKYNFDVGGVSLSDFINDIDVSNTVNGRIIYYLINQSNLTIDTSSFPQLGYLALVNSTNVVVKNLISTNNGQGLLLAFITNSTIENITAMDNLDAIELHYSNNNVLSRNSVTNNDGSGALLTESSKNMLTDNDVRDNDGWGMWLVGSESNRIVGNNVINNYGGISINGYNNIVVRNNVINNSLRGIQLLWKSGNNKIFHNNFINNTRQAYLTDSSINTWNNGYPSGGNYWSDYAGVDLNYDGIGDMPYVIDANNHDNCPLMGMFSVFNATSEYQVQTICNSTIAGFQFNGTAIIFKVTGEGGTAGFCRICIPTALMDSPYDVLVDGIEVPFTLLPCSNATQSYLYFAYAHSTHEIIIRTHAVPPPPLLVSISPVSASIYSGQSVTFTSTISGGYTPYNYQWYLNGAPVSGATLNTWTFTPTASGIYYVHLKVTDAKENTAQSDTARIAVATVPVGGYSFPIQVTTKAEPIIPYIALIATLTAIFTKLRPKTKRKH
jgi:parallel beta-helix repeat protein